MTRRPNHSPALLPRIIRHAAAGLLALSASLYAPAHAEAQELNCTVEVNGDQVEGTTKDVMESLQQAIADYVNTTRFTPAQIGPGEKIECRMLLVVKEWNDDTFTGELQVQSSRPVFNSTYTTTLLNHRDTNVSFTWRPGEPLVFSATNYESQLTSILNFWVYTILGLDFDSFSPQGGRPYFEQAAQIVAMAQGAGQSGWRAFDDTKNRAAVSSVFNDGVTSGVHNLLYAYHRQGLDEMAGAPDKGRARITEALKELDKINQAAPMSVALTLFHDSKLDEVLNIYSRGQQAERTAVAKQLSEIYPTDAERINEIKETTTKK